MRGKYNLIQVVCAEKVQPQRRRFFVAVNRRGETCWEFLSHFCLLFSSAGSRRRRRRHLPHPPSPHPPLSSSSSPSFSSSFLNSSDSFRPSLLPFFLFFLHLLPSLFLLLTLPSPPLPLTSHPPPLFLFPLLLLLLPFFSWAKVRNNGLLECMKRDSPFSLVVFGFSRRRRRRRRR